MKKISIFVSCLLLIGCLCSCGAEERGKVVFTTSLTKDELFRIAEVSCTLPEYMIYLANIRNKYEEAFGEDIWSVSCEGVSLEENIKDNVLAHIAQVKSVYLLAKTKEIVLSENEEIQIKSAAEQYFKSLTEAEAEKLGVTQELVEQLYRENLLADKVYLQIVSSVNPEISDDEARTIVVEQIFIPTSAEDYQGNQMVYTEGMKADALKKINDIREMAVSGEHEFTQLAAKYNEENNVRISIRIGEADPAVEKVAFQLQTDEISEVIETDKGYCILKCISTFEREQTDANKLVLVEKRKRDAFGKEYDAFVNTLARKLNDKLWQKVELEDTDGVNTNSFFQIYDECLQKF